MGSFGSNIVSRNQPVKFNHKGEKYLYAVHALYFAVLDFKRKERRIFRLVERDIADMPLVIKQPCPDCFGLVFFSKPVCLNVVFLSLPPFQEALFRSLSEKRGRCKIISHSAGDLVVTGIWTAKKPAHQCVPTNTKG